MNTFPLFRGLRRQRLKPSGCRSAKPTKGAGIGFALAILIYGLIAAVPIRAQDESSILYPGTYQAEDARITLADDAKMVDAADAEGGKAVETNEAAFVVSATDVIVRWRGSGTFQIQSAENDSSYVVARPLCGDTNLPCLRVFTGWLTTQLPLSTTAQRYSIILRSEYKEVPFTIDSITVLDRTFENLFPYIAAIGITLGMTLFVVISALLERWQR